MRKFDSDLMEAMLVPATEAGGRPADSSLATHDDLERLAFRTAMMAGDQPEGANPPPPPPPTRSATERCHHTCGGCRG